MTPGIHDSLPEADYFASPALSQSQAKTLLDNPARYKWELTNPREHRDAFDIGHAAHAKVLGVGAEVVAIDADSKRGKAWTEPADAARAEGKVPLLRKDADAVDAMAEAVLAHPGARVILEAEGASEQSMFWTDPDTGVDCRARVDRLTSAAVVDLKTCADASPGGFSRAAANFGYDLQADFYPWGYEVITGERLPFVFVCVEKTPPHFVALYTLPGSALDRGQRRRRDALDLYRRCVDTDTWPAFGDDINTLPWPRWAA